MHIIDPNDTLADLVTANPALAVHLDRIGLDYCCGGRRRLADAVDEAGLDVEQVLDALATAEPVPADDWSSMSAIELADHLESTHHAYLREALPRVCALADKVAAVHGERHPELAEVARLVVELQADLEPHLLKEEQVLFPMIRELDGATMAPEFHCGTLANPIRVMSVEHDAVGDLLARLRATALDYAVPADGCASYNALFTALAELEADTHLHVHKENNLLFPAVLAGESALGRPATMTHDLDDRDQIAEFVRCFYREVAQDERLHHWFGTIARVDWHAHTGDLTDYWVGVLLGEPHDDADDVIEAHRWLHDADPFDRELFDRWLELFDTVLDARWQGPMAERARHRAHGLAWAMSKRLTGHAERRAS